MLHVDLPSRAEIERLVAAIERAETVGIPWDTNEDSPGAKHLPRRKEDRRTKIGPHAAAALRLLMLTGARLREILHLRWTEVDFEKERLFLSDSKTGRKTIVLNTPALTILSKLERVGEFVIAGDDPKSPRKDLKRPWAAVSNAAGLKGVRLHDLRHTYAAILAEENYSLQVIGKMMGHANPKTTDRYAHIGDSPTRKAAEVVGDAIMSKRTMTRPQAANDDEAASVKNA